MNVPGLCTGRQEAAWSRVTGLVHALGGRIIAQLWHAGANSHPDLLRGALPAGPSAVNPQEITRTPAGRRETLTPREMTSADIDGAIADYAAAAARARRAGFDGVEIAANGTYLIAQFLNRRLNRRSDGYGAHRGRLLLEIVDALGHELAASDPATHYSGGARGYVDYPIWPAGARVAGPPAGQRMAIGK